MEKSLRVKDETMKCYKCNQQFTAIMAYMPSDADVCLRCLTNASDKGWSTRER